jgi:CRP/FNR family transcriptional regulator, cyclic AMP receptor protein
MRAAPHPFASPVRLLQLPPLEIVSLRGPNDSMVGPSIDKDTLLASLPQEMSAALFGHGPKIKLAPGQILFLAGDAGEGCYRINSGLLKASVVSAAGGERILGIFGPGTIVGELSMIDGHPRSASVTAIRESQLVFLSRADFDVFGSANPEIYRRLMVLLARRLRDLDGSLLATSFLSLKGRTARVLLSLADAYGESVGLGRIMIRQKVSQSDLAAMAGIARENVSRIINDWTRRAVVSRIAGYYCLEDRAKLERELAN